MHYNRRTSRLFGQTHKRRHFVKLKEALVSAPVLAMPRDEGTFLID